MPGTRPSGGRFLRRAEFVHASDGHYTLADGMQLTAAIFCRQNGSALVELLENGVLIM